MIDIGYVESRLNQEPKDERLPLRSWCRDLISDVRKANSKLYGSICMVTKLRDEVKDLEKRMTSASEAFDQDNFGTGMELLRHED